MFKGSFATLAILGLMAVVLVSACAQLSSVVCKPNWVMSAPNMNMYGNRSSDLCKSQCYGGAKVTSYKIENDTCYCDINNCNP